MPYYTFTLFLIRKKKDIPYLQDGRSVDTVFNPLGVLSQMDVGKIF